MALSKEMHIKLGGRFLSLPRLMALSNRANRISKRLSLKYLHLSCYREKPHWCPFMSPFFISRLGESNQINKCAISTNMWWIKSLKMQIWGCLMNLRRGFKGFPLHYTLKSSAIERPLYERVYRLPLLLWFFPFIIKSLICPSPPHNSNSVNCSNTLAKLQITSRGRPNAVLLFVGLEINFTRVSPHRFGTRLNGFTEKQSFSKK